MYTIFVLMLTLLGLIVFSDNGLVELNRLRRERARIAERNLLLTQKNSRLYRIIERLKSDPAYVDYTARKELGMVGTHQLIFKVSDVRKVDPPRQKDE
jgi:cell division protein FtsB